MTKISSTIILVLFVMVLAFVGVFTFIPNILEDSENPTSYDQFYSPTYLMLKDSMFTDALSTNYKVEMDEGVTADQVKNIINNRLNSIYGYYGSKIDVTANSATVVVPENHTVDAKTVLDVVTARGEVVVLSDTSGTYSADNIILNAEHFTGASTQTIISNGQPLYTTLVYLNDAGKAADTVVETSSYVTFAVDETVVGSVQYISDGTLYFFSNTIEIAEQVAAYINTGILAADLTVSEQTVIPGSGLLFLGIALAVIVIACGVFFVVRYGVLGVVGTLAQLLSLVVFAIFAGLVHIELLNIFAVVGLVLGLALQTYFTIRTFEAIRGYSDKTFAAARHKGFADNNKLNLIVHGIVLVVGIILWVIPTGVTAPMGNVLVYLAVLSFVATMGFNRLFAGIVAPFVKDTNSARK